MNNHRDTDRPGRTPGGCLSALLLALALPAAISAPGCEREAPAPAPAPAAAPTASPDAGPAATYEIRGVIVELPDVKKPSSNLSIHHEAIPSFTANGKVVGMAEMTMPFPLAPGVSLEGLAVGDVVSFTMEVREQPRMNYRVTRITKLPPDTKLDLKAAEHGEGHGETPAPQPK